jgi:hypothetical protein
MKRYSILPVTLYRFQSFKLPKLREKSLQKKLGKFSFDFVLGTNGLYNPARGDKYPGPNGLSLRPIGANLAELLRTTYPTTIIYELPKDLPVPASLVMIHEHTDHYSLQTKESIEPEQFCL